MMEDIVEERKIGQQDMKEQDIIITFRGGEEEEEREED